MEAIIALLSALVALGIGTGAGYVIQGRRLKRSLGDAEAKAKSAAAQASGVLQEAEAQKRSLIQEAEAQKRSVVQEAEAQKRSVVQEAEQESRRQRTALEVELREWRSELQKLERRLTSREEALERRTETLEKRDRGLVAHEQEVERRSTEVEALRLQQVRALEAVAKMTAAEAKEVLLRRAEEDAKQELGRQYYELQQRFKEEADQNGRKLLVESMQRLASDVVSESTVTVVPLPNDEMKGRLIGREGRNIRAIEQATGVDLIIDDTPEAVTISCFDPIRREVARLTLTKLISDGRVHPARIEEAVVKARQEVDQVVLEAGKRATLEAGVGGLDPEVVKLLGRLVFRTSYGQNVLQHSMEMSLIASMLAHEVGANVEIVKAGALLHDIGKALTHEVEGPHAEIGADVARRHGVPDAVLRCIREHHDPEQSTIESALVHVADTISGGRPGARRDTLERYAKRLEELEAVVNSFPGIEKCYAIQAGREVRVIVKPEQVDDVQASVLARDVAVKIQEKLAFPGQIKVVVIRETRSTEYAR
ncbi:MAG: ribonuclease Y [Dehalococcoidia bacterium]|nr:ribonuclease Y [Dehalococcoidia bacterium]